MGTKTSSKRFQSTPPHGRRHTCRCSASKCIHSFNPRLRTGGDYFPCVDADCPILFQSTPPHGRRHIHSVIHSAAKKFQSPPPHGRRPECSRPSKLILIEFQSTPPHGRRLGLLGHGAGVIRVSIHASAREATQIIHLISSLIKVSIHASAREAT